MIKSDKILFRSGASSQWLSVNSKLELGESGYEIDGNALKIGSGSQTWSDLPYLGCKGIVDSEDITSKKYKISSAAIVTESGTSRVLSSNDNGIVLLCTSGSDVTLTVGTSIGNTGFSLTVIQNGLGKVIFSPSSTTVNNRQSHTKTAGQYAIVSLICVSTNTFILAGDTGT